MRAVGRTYAGAPICLRSYSPQSASRFIPYVAVEAVMNSPAPLPANRVDHASSDALEDCVEQTVVQVREAANELTAQNGRLDPEPRTESMRADYSRNPVRALAIGMACLLAAMAAVIAFG